MCFGLHLVVMGLSTVCVLGLLLAIQCQGLNWCQHASKTNVNQCIISLVFLHPYVPESQVSTHDYSGVFSKEK